MTKPNLTSLKSKSINCKGRLIELNQPKIMGILNITPDSFYDGGKFRAEKAIVAQTQKMLDEGATLIDVGAYSSRPGAKHISEEEECGRILPVIELLVKIFPNILLSVDTFRSNIAKICVEKGACMVNDISGGNADPKMFETVCNLQVPYVMMHMQGMPQNMQNHPKYDNIVVEILKELSKKAFQLRSMGLNDLVFDVGFGFGKTLAHNYELLQNLDLFHQLNGPILTGVSRKSMLYKPLNTTADKALNATSVGHTIALQKGSQILRVHDVAEAMEVITITGMLKNASSLQHH